MGFLTGPATLRRFAVDVPILTCFDGRHIEALDRNAAGKSRVISGDGIDVGWAGGEHLLDTKFSYAKNTIEDNLLWSMRIDKNNLPKDVLKAYTAIDLAALSKNNPSGMPSARQKREAKESARDRLEQEAKDGRFIKRKLIECLWDLRFGEVMLADTGDSNLVRFIVLFNDTFHSAPRPLDAWTEAVTAADRLGLSSRLSALAVSQFGREPHDSVAWSPHEDRATWLGNEFLTWLWWASDSCQTIRFGDGSDLTVMMAGGVKLECPRGMTGNDTCNSEFPQRMPELIAGLREGKLPRKAGIIFVRFGEQYTFTLHAETLALSGLKVPLPEDESEHARKCSRLKSIASCVHSLRLVYEHFISLRLTPGWAKIENKIQEWVLR